MWWSCSELIFSVGSKECRKNYPHNQEILLIVCSIQSKKIGNLTSPLLILALVQMIPIPTENYLLLSLLREFRRLANSDTVCSYLLSNSTHTFHIECILLINLQYKLDCGCQLHYLPYRPRKNQKLCISCDQKSLLKLPFFYTGNPSLYHSKEKWMQIQWHRQQSIWCHWKVFVVENDCLYTSH